MSTITASPTLSNPNAFDTVAELRIELHRANEKLLFAVEQTHRLAVRHDTVLAWCTTLAEHHENGNHDAVKKCLDEVVANKNRHQKTQH